MGICYSLTLPSWLSFNHWPPSSSLRNPIHFGDRALHRAPVHLAGQLIYLWILTPERLNPISYTSSVWLGFFSKGADNPKPWKWCLLILEHCLLPEYLPVITLRGILSHLGVREDLLIPKEMLCEEKSQRFGTWQIWGIPTLLLNLGYILNSSKPISSSVKMRGVILTYMTTVKIK